MFKNLYNHIKRNSFFDTLMHSKNYFAANIATKAIAVISLPIITRFLSPNDYGLVNVFISYINILLALLTLNCYTALGRYYYEKNNDFREFFGTSIVTIFPALLLFFLLTLYFKSKISSLMTLPPIMIPFIIPMVMIYVCNSWFEQIYIPQKQSKKIAKRNIFQAYIGFILSIVLIIIMPKNIKYMGIICSNLIIGLLFAIYYYFELKPYFALTFRIEHFKYMIDYSVPLLLYSLSGVILAQFDRIMINKYLGAGDTGLYSFAYNIGMLLTLLVGSLYQAWMPDYYKHMDNKDYKQLDKDAGKIFNIIIIAAFLLMLFGREIGYILASSKYHAGLSIIPIIVIGCVFNAAFAFYGWNMGYAKKNAYLSLTVLIAGSINILLNAATIPRYGYIAGAYSTTISYFFMALMAWSVSKYILHLYTISLDIIIKPLSILAIFSLFFYLLMHSNFNVYTFVFSKIILALIFFMVMINMFTNFISLKLIARFKYIK